jgi:tRNA(fMet)-specific endonuclease VapC
VNETLSGLATMPKTLLDTDTFSEVLKRKNPNVSRNATAYRSAFGFYTVSIITVVEMVKGFQRVGRQDRIDSLLRGLASEEVLPLDYEAGVLAGRIYGELERTGQTIGRADPMIAAIAIQQNLALATGNMRHFDRIQHLGFPLVIVDWYSEMAPP